DMVQGAGVSASRCRNCRRFRPGQGIRRNAPESPSVLQRTTTNLARSIHERFCYNHRPAATTSLRPAGSPLGPSTYCSSTHRALTAPRAGLAMRLSDFATNRHEYCGLTMWIYLNDRFVKEEEAVVSVFDHGFLYGDGVYETIRSY